MRNFSIKSKCPLCGKENEVMVNKDDFKKWRNGEFIQRAFPYLNASERELLMTGICDQCWDTIKEE